MAALPNWRFVHELTALIIQLISGTLGGNAAGNLSKDTSLGPLGNTIAGALGGGEAVCLFLLADH